MPQSLYKALAIIRLYLTGKWLYALCGDRDVAGNIQGKKGGHALAMAVKPAKTPQHPHRPVTLSSALGCNERVKLE